MKRINTVIHRVSQLRQGDVVAVPLRKRLYAFGRVYREPSLAVFAKASPKLLPLEAIAQLRVLFHIGFVETKGQVCDWILLGKLPFEKPDDAWPPALYIQDRLEATHYQIYHRAKLRKASKREIAGLQRFEMQPLFMIRERILEELRIRKSPSRANQRAGSATQY